MDSRPPQQQQQRQRSRLRWWHPLLVVLLAILLPVVISVIRFVNDWDLIPVRERAAELGIELEPEQPVPDPEDRQLALELTELLTMHQPFEKSDLKYELSYTIDSTLLDRHPHGPIASIAKDYIEKQRPADRQRTWAILEQWAEKARPLHLSPGQKSEQFDAVLLISNWAKEQILLAQPSLLPTHCHLLLNATGQTYPGDPISLLIYHSLAAISCNAIMERLPALKKLSMAELQTIARAIDSNLHDWDDRHRLIGVSGLIDSFHHLSQEDLWNKHMTGPTFGLQESRTWHLYSLFGRQQFLLSMLDHAIAIRQSDQPLHTMRGIGGTTIRLSDIGFSQRILEPSAILESTQLPAYSMIAENALFTRARLELLKAELVDEPWPTDPFDEQGGPLCRITIDNRLLAAYSVGPDGHDDGGDPTSDRVFWLYGYRDADGSVTWGQETIPVIEIDIDESLLEHLHDADEP